MNSNGLGRFSARVANHTSMTSVHEWTGDLLFVAGLTVLATGAVVQGGVPDPIRVLVVIPLLLFLPGYAIVSFVYPGRPTDGGTPGTSERRSIDAVERVAFSLVLSLAVVPTVAGVANFITGIEPRPVALGVAAVTLGSAVLALVARSRTPPEVRFRIDSQSLLGGVEQSFTASSRSLRRQQGLFDAQSGKERLFNVLLVVAVIAVVASTGYAAVGAQSPADDATFTEFYLLGESESGELTTDAVPTNFSQGEARPITLGVENHEEQSVEYSAVVQLQRVGPDGRVEETSKLDRVDLTVPAGGSERVELPIAPDLAGEDLRLVFLLYQGDPPASPAQSNAYLETRVLVDVDSGGQAALAAPDRGTTRSGVAG